MGIRNVYGYDHSSNGWPMVDTGSCTWVTVPGTSVSLQIQNGQPLQILRAFVADINAYVERVRDGDTACWTPGNSVPSSNHLSGTAVDIDWELHPFRIEDAGWSPDQIATIRQILDFYEGTVFWGNDWSDPKDAMHFQLASLANGGDIDTYQNPHTQDFINRKIRSDGFSTFRRGNTQAPAPDAGAAILARATGLSEGRAAEILPAVAAGLIASECTNPNRIAMWLAQVGEESGSFQYTEEIAKNGRYAPYIGRTWIQITWESNYAKFGQWCFDKGLVPTPNHFVDYPVQLADLKWAGLGAAWYWTVERPDINELSDQRDVHTVTYRINGGYNGLDDRINRFNRALPLGDQLLALVSATPAPDEWETLMTLRVKSLSIYATPGEPDIAIEDLIRSIDAHGNHEDYVEIRARKGDPDSLMRVARTASGQGQYGNAAFAVKQATDVLNDIEKNSPGILTAYLATKGNS